jgi:hypothetical protein
MLVSSPRVPALAAPSLPTSVHPTVAPGSGVMGPPAELSERGTLVRSGFAGHDSGAQLVGLFNVSVLHNIVHLLFGVAGLALARTTTSARFFLLGGGVIYLVLWIYGLIIDQHSMANFIPINTPDNWLHVVLGVGMIALGVLLARLDARTRTRTPTSTAA